MVGASGNDPDLEQPSAAKALIRRSRALHLRRKIVIAARFEPALSPGHARPPRDTLKMATCTGLEPVSAVRQTARLTRCVTGRIWCARSDSNGHCTASRTVPSAIGVRARTGRPPRERSVFCGLRDRCITLMLVVQIFVNLEDSGGYDPLAHGLKVRSLSSRV